MASVHTDRDPGWTTPQPRPVEDFQSKPTVLPGSWPYDPADETNVWWAMGEGGA